MRRQALLLLLIITMAGAANPARGDSPTTPTATVKPKSSGPIAPPRRDVPGKRWELGPKRQIFVPDFFAPGAKDERGNNAPTQVVVFFHGAAWCAEQTFYEARKNAVLLTVNATGDGDFESMAEQFPGLLDSLRETLAAEGVTSAPLGALCLASFSGGYTAVRSILRDDVLAHRVNVVVLADSLYGPRLSGRDGPLDPIPQEPFVRYARRAAESDPAAEFWFTHLYPPLEEHRGNTTTVAATNLIKSVGAERRPYDHINSRKAQALYRADKGRFHVIGYSGMTTQDHFEHFYAFGDLLQLTSLAPVPANR